VHADPAQTAPCSSFLFALAILAQVFAVLVQVALVLVDVPLVLVAVNADGVPKWSAATQGQIVASPAVGGDAGAMLARIIERAASLKSARGSVVEDTKRTKATKTARASKPKKKATPRKK